MNSKYVECHVSEAWDEGSPNTEQIQTQEQTRVTTHDSRNFTISIFGKCSISICKALVPLKLSLFLYYGAGSFMVPFLTLFYKQRGITLPQLSTMSMVSPIFQFLGTTLSGIAADKSGRTRPVLVVNLLLMMCSVASIMILPQVHSDIHLSCQTNVTTTFETSVVNGKSVRLHSCRCLDGECVSERCLNVSSEHLVHANSSSIQWLDGSFQYEIMSYGKQSGTDSWCNGGHEQCGLSCKGLESDWLMAAYAVFFVIIQTTFTNCYRCLDVACMTVAHEHGSTFGRERVFAMLGNVVVSPIAGYVANYEKSYLSPFYLYLGLNSVLLPVLYMMPEGAKSPGKKMWKKSGSLLRRPEVLIFLAVVFVMGTAWNFRKLFLFWHLEGLGASGMLLGLVTSVNALYGLPFLITSQWWVAQCGSTVVFVAALFAHALNATGYALLRDPWFALGLEVTDAVAYYVMWVAAVEYSNQVAPEGLTATVIATSGAVHFTAGKVSAGLMGRFIMHRYGGRSAFGFCALLTATVAILYAAYLCIGWKTKHKKHLAGMSYRSVDSRLFITTVQQTSNGNPCSKQVFVE